MTAIFGVGRVLVCSISASLREKEKTARSGGAGLFSSRLVLALTALFFLARTPLPGAGFPSGFSESRIASGLAKPTAMAFAPDGRLFVCEQGGKLRVIKNGTLLSTPFLTLSVSSSGERGLLGVAFDPNFASNRFLYVYYTAKTPSTHNRVSRFTANGDVVLSGSEIVLLDLNNLSATNHNGGAIHFGSDGKLYIATGDNANSGNSQSKSNLLGKILRINSDGTIPTSNPFYATTTGSNRSIWALGLRNPFTFAVQPGTGRIFINDVGQATWEEINDGIAGANYGWPAEEGPGSGGGYVYPIYAYPQGGGGGAGCAIAGGVFYEPPVSQFPSSYEGKYFFADFCNGWIEELDPADGSRSGFATGITDPVDLDVSSDGSLYYLARGSGSTTGIVSRIQYTASQAPAITQHPLSLTVSIGQPATFNVSASGSSPLSYQWQRNGADIVGATSSAYALPSAQTPDSGAQFRCRVTNAYGTATSNSATLTVITNSLPVAAITQPSSGTLYAAGDTISYAGTGTDAEDGALAAGAFTWQVDFHHDTHSHPFLPATGGAKSGSFTAPTSGESASNVWYRILLTVRDSKGAAHTVSRDVLPQTSTIILAASPAGAQVSLDGQPQAAPFSTIGVEGFTRTLGTVSPQSLAGATWAFDSWSDGGGTAHDIATPANDTTYTAVYRVASGSIGAGAGLDAEYFDNKDFTGASVRRVDRTVNFAWGGAPAPGIGADTFSVRWTGQVQAQFTGTHTFYTQSDDGVRLWVNGQLLVNNWTNHALTENSGTIALTAGQRYDIRMEFYDNAYHAAAKLLWSGTSTPKSVVPGSQLYGAAGPGPGPSGDGLTAEYYDNLDFTALSVTRVDAVVNFNWGTGAPASGMGSNSFSVRWSGEVEPQFSETYTFYTQSDDGVRLWVNGQLVVDNWTDHALTENGGTITLAGGQRYAVRMEFYDNTGAAVAKLLWSSASTPKALVPQSRLFSGGGIPGTGLTGEYYENLDLTSLQITRVDPAVDFDWGTGGPASGVTGETFSVRWTGEIEAAFTEVYTFFTQSDDGVRLWVNGQLVVDNWTNHALTENSGTIPLAAGQRYAIRLEFYEDGGSAEARLLWQSPSTPKAIVPQSRLYP